MESNKKIEVSVFRRYLSRKLLVISSIIQFYRPSTEILAVRLRLFIKFSNQPNIEECCILTGIASYLNAIDYNFLESMLIYVSRWKFMAFDFYQQIVIMKKKFDQISILNVQY